MAVMARRFNIPVFVLAESVKCIRFFPLAQKDLATLPNALKVRNLYNYKNLHFFKRNYNTEIMQIHKRSYIFIEAVSFS